jgi:hypothetical protein
MSLADVVQFTSQPQVKNNVVGPVLLAIFENLLRTTWSYCDSK